MLKSLLKKKIAFFTRAKKKALFAPKMSKNLGQKVRKK